MTLSPASPTISTLASAGGTVGSTSVHDTATLSGGYNETGNITFTLKNGSNATVFSDTESASANSAVQSKSFTPTVAGTYTWSVTFAGDVNNNGPITAGSSGESVTLGKASPTITASAGATEVIGACVPGDAMQLTASATISGGYNETGNVTFSLYAPNGNLLTTEAVPVSGNGTYTTPSGYTPSIAGTYQWVASYSGDGNNNGVSTTYGNTPEVAVGAGNMTTGNALYLVGGNSTNDQLNITPFGTYQNGSSGINVNGQLNGVNINNQTYTGFTTIYVVGFAGNENFQFAGSLTIATVICAGNGNDQIQLDNGANNVTLGNGNDNIQQGGGGTQGGNGNNLIVAGNGNDQVQLGNGNNTVTLGSGNDQVNLGTGNNIVTASNGNDNVQLGTGNNTVTLGNGNDQVQANNGSGNNTVTLGTGNDNIQLANGTNKVMAGAAGSTGNIQVQLGSGANNMVTLAGNGNDQVKAGSGASNQVSITGNGNDQVTLGDGAGDMVTITDTGNGNDQVQVGNGNNDSVSILGNGTGNDQVQVGNGNNDSVSIVGTGNENVQTGNGNGTVHVTSSNKNLHLGTGWTQI